MVTTEVRGRLLVNAPMARYSSWRTGGRAAQLFIPADMQDLADFVWALDPQVELHFVGLGSNLLIRDGGVDGVLVRLAPGLNELNATSDGMVHAQAGVAAPKLARFAFQRGLAGLDFMVGIPGSVGGALAMNAGCYGSSTWDSVHSVTVLCRDGEIQEAPAHEFIAEYRSVRHQRHSLLLFLAAKFRLQQRVASDAEAIARIMRMRDETQPIGTANAGSVFVNPPGDSAGRLIDTAGLSGYQIGGAQISPQHCNFIINQGGASATDIENLIEHARATVLAKHRIELQLEVKILGKKL